MAGQIVTHCFAHVLVVGREAMLPSVAGPAPEPIEYNLAGDEEHDLVEPAVERVRIGGIPRLVDSRQEQAAAAIVHEVAGAVVRGEDATEYECRRWPGRIAVRKHYPQADILSYVCRQLDDEARLQC